MMPMHPHEAVAERPSDAIDLLAIFAHPDDAELHCGGTLLRAADQGYRTAILDLTAGESGTRGSPEIRRREAERAAEILGLATRRNAGLPDGALENSPAARATVARFIRELQPLTVILHGPAGRHPDHRAAHQLGRDACFIAGLRRAPVEGSAYRPAKVIFATTFQEEPAKPSFVVDISDYIERKLDAIFAYESQFDGRTLHAGDVFGGHTRPLRDQIRAHCAHYGSLIRRDFGEPFLTLETLRVDDVVRLPVRSI